MDRNTGKPLSGTSHLAQSIADILTTPIGSRVGRRDYGSLLPRLLDQPYNGQTRLRLFAATAGALARWEPRIAVKQVSLDRQDEGGFLLTIAGRRTDVPAATSLTKLSVPLPGTLA
jgi:hypothetical protein